MLARSPFFVSISQNINDHINLFSALCFPSEFHVKLRLETLRMRRFQLKCVCLRSGWTEPPVSGRSTIRTSQCFHTAGFQVVGRATTGGCQEHEAPPFVFSERLRQKTRFWSRHLDFYRRWRPTSDGRGCFYNPANQRKPDDPPEGLSYREQHLRDGTTLHTLRGKHTHTKHDETRDTTEHRIQPNTQTSNRRSKTEHIKHNHTQSTTKHRNRKQRQETQPYTPNTTKPWQRKQEYKTQANT